MTQAQFNNIMKSWQEVLDQAKSHYDNILSQKDLFNLKVIELQELVAFSKKFIQTMEFLFCDFRHILGMSKLKVTDRSKLTSLFNEICAYRSDAKRIAQIEALNNISYIPVQSKYKLKLTPSITLVSPLREGQKEGIILDDTELENTNLDNIKIEKDKNIITVTFQDKDLLDIRKLFNKATKQDQDPTIGLDSFKEKLQSGKCYGLPTYYEDGSYTMTLTDADPSKKPLFTFFDNLK